MLAIRILAGSWQVAGCIVCGLWGLMSCSQGQALHGKVGHCTNVRLWLPDTQWVHLGYYCGALYYATLTYLSDSPIWSPYSWRGNKIQKAAIQCTVNCWMFHWLTQSHTPVHLRSVTETWLKMHKCSSCHRAIGILCLQHTVKILVICICTNKIIQWLKNHVFSSQRSHLITSINYKYTHVQIHW